MKLIRAAALLGVVLAYGYASAGPSRAVVGLIRAAPLAAPIAGGCPSTQSLVPDCQPANQAGRCSCFKFSGSVVGSLAGRGSAYMEMTVDTGTQTSDPEGCALILATFTLKAPRTMTINAIGARCTASLKTAEEGIAGGYGITSSKNGVTGNGTFTGDLDNHDNLTIRLSGEIVP